MVAAGAASGRTEEALSLTVLGLACCASNLSVRAIDPILPVIAGEFSITLHQAAWLATAYSIPYAVAPLLIGPLADTYGKSVVVKTCCALLVIGFAGCALAPSFADLMVARAISGVVAAGIVPAIFALVGDRIAFARRQVWISRIVVAAITGQMGGAALAGALAHYLGWRSVFIASMVFTAGVAAGAYFRLNGKGEPRRDLSLKIASADYGALLTDRRALIVYGTVFCEGLFMFGVFPFIAAMLTSRGQGGTLVAGLCIAAFAFGGAIYGLSAHHIVRNLGPWRMVGGGGIIVALCYGVMAEPVPAVVAGVMFAIAGFGFYLLHNTMQTFSTELSTTARGAAVALFALFYFVGQGLGPVLFAQVSAAAGYGIMFAVSAVLAGLLGIVSAGLLRRTQADGSAVAK